MQQGVQTDATSRVTSDNVELICEQALRGSLAAWWGQEGELATTSLEFEFHLQFLCGFLLTELSDSANQREVETSANVNKH